MDVRIEHRRRSWGVVLVSIGLLITLGGCVNTGQTPESRRALVDYFTGHYADAERVLEPLAQKTDEDYVLNNLRLGSVAMVDQQWQMAEGAFYRAYEVMNSTGVNDGGRGAAAAIVHEKFKVWKGEPFERAMCNYYLGLIYYMRQDYNNARAAFENALFKLRDYADDKDEKKYQEVESDFAGAYIMLARCWMRLGDQDKAQDMFERAAHLRPDLRTLASYRENEKTNVLLVIDYGQGPQKTTIYDNSVVTFLPRPIDVGPIPRPRVMVDGKPYDVRGLDEPPQDLLALAQDRRWQDIDTIRLTKSIVGKGMMAAGAYELGNGLSRRNAKSRQQEGWLGAALLAGGALLDASSGADLRHWEMLPRTTFIVPLQLDPGTYTISVDFGGRPQTWKGIVAPAHNDLMYYFRLANTVVMRPGEAL